MNEKGQTNRNAEVLGGQLSLPSEAGAIFHKDYWKESVFLRN